MAPHKTRPQLPSNGQGYGSRQLRWAVFALGRPRVRDALMLLLFFLLTAVWFHRLMFHLHDAVLVGPNDESYSIRQYWAALHLGKTPFTLHRDPLNGAPEGLPISTAVQIANFIIPGSIWALHYAFGLTAAENIFLLGGFVLTGFSVYLLLDRLGFHPLASLYAAYAMMFNPWMIERAYAGHHGFMQAWVFPLEIAALLYAHTRRSVLSAVLVGLAIAVAFYETSYYGLLAILVFVVFWTVDLLQQRTRDQRFWSFTLADISIFTTVVAFTPALIAWYGDRKSVAAQISNPVEDLQNLGAAPQSYVLPSVRNPVLGGITRHFDPLADRHWAENTLYLGVSMLTLGVIGAVLIWRKHPETRKTPRLRFFLVCMLILAPAAFLCSLKRETNVLGLNVPMPAYLMGEVTTFWRVFARFGLLVTFALATLAALTLHTAIHRWRRGVVFALAAFALLVFEYDAGVAPIYSFAKPAPYAIWLKGEPPGIVANYPLPTDQPAALQLLAKTYYEQMVSQHPQFAVFGSGYGGTREDAIRILARYVTDPLTPGILKAEGVRYVLLHDNVYRAEGVQPPPVPAGMHLVAQLAGNVRVLELDRGVQSADLTGLLNQNAASIALVQGLPVPKLSTDGLDIGSRSTSVRLNLSWSDPRLAVVQFLIHATSSQGPRTLELVDASGRVAGQANVQPTDTQVVLGPTTVKGLSATYTLRAQPPGDLKIESIQAQPLANVTKSIRNGN